MDVQRLVRTQISTADLAPPQELIQGINNGETQLLQVVKALGEYLTSTEDNVRLNGLTFMSNLLSAISPSKINRQATTTLVNFYLSKLDDFDSLPPALTSLTVLSRLPTFDDSAAEDVYHGVVENVNMKAYAQATRHLVYVLFDSLLASHRDALKKMGTDFLNSYTKMIDGEKDPRNLMLLFSLDRIILLEFDVQSHIEDFFDVTYCYFPITFRPPPNDPYGITADDLKAGLRSCMASSPYFAKMALPLFLEKFATATGASMKDLLLSMAACFPTFGSAALTEHTPALWEAIKTEILYSSDIDIESSALIALESLMRTLYPTEDDVPSGLAQEVIKECSKLFEEPDKSQALGGTKIVGAIFRGSPSAGKFALTQIMPQLFRAFNTPTLPSHRAPLLSAISSILLACQSTYSSLSSTRSHDQEASLEPYRHDLLDVLREGLRTEGLKAPAIKGCVALVGVVGYLEKLETEELVKGLDEILVNDENPDIRPEVIQALTSISASYSATIESFTLPLLFLNLPDTAPPASDVIAREKYRSILDSLSKLCVSPALWQTMIIRITTKLDFLASSASSSISDSVDVNMEGEEDIDSRECAIAYAWDLLHALFTVLSAKIKLKHVDVGKYFDKLVPILYGLVISAAQVSLGKGAQMPVFRDRRLVGMVAKIGGEMVSQLPSEKQATKFESMYAAFEKGDLSQITPPKLSIQPFSPLRPNAPSAEQDIVALYSAFILCLSPSTTLSIPDYAQYLSGKIHWTVRVARDGWQVNWGLKMVCGLVNKKEGDLREALQSVLNNVWAEVQDTTQDSEIRHRALSIYFHIIKALSLLRLPSAYTALERIIDILCLSNMDPVLVGYAAEGFGILAKKGDGHLTSKLLYAQKLWNFVLPKLIAGDKDANGKGRIVYLVAFASLLPLVPASLCISDLSTILPLIQRSLSLSSPLQRTNSILTLTSILETPSSPSTDTILHSSAPSLVSSLLISSISSPGIPSSPAVRKAALAALGVIPDTIRFEALHKEKAGVIKELGKAVDDGNREVRKEAVECRAKWFRYGQAV